MPASGDPHERLMPRQGDEAFRESPPPPTRSGRTDAYRTQLVLLLATLVSVFMAGAMYEYPEAEAFSLLGVLVHLYRGWPFAVPLMAILLAHELGHYIAARYHGVRASLPYFLPLPFLSPFGTMGAVIAMRAPIRSPNALLDIGAAGPLAGMVVAIPVLVIGLAQSEVHPLTGGGLLEGQSLLYLAIKRLVVGAIPPGHDVFVTSTAFAGWAGLLVTVVNLLPVGQLDGGHIAYALLGPRQDRLARVLHASLPLLFLYNLLLYERGEPGMVWLVWFFLLMLIRRASGKKHPPTDPGALTAGRRLVGALCLLLFVLLFMPTPMRGPDPLQLEPWMPLIEQHLPPS